MVHENAPADSRSREYQNCMHQQQIILHPVIIRIDNIKNKSHAEIPTQLETNCYETVIFFFQPN